LPLSSDDRLLLDIGITGSEFVDKGLGQLMVAVFLEVIARKPEEKKSE